MQITCRSGLVLLLLQLLAPSLAAQATQTDYLSRVQGLSGAALKTAVHDLVQPHTVLSYGGGEGHTWAGFAQADDMGDGTVRDRYSMQERRFNGAKAVEGMNIEHIWANSWWGHTVNNAYCDLFNLYPADRDANGRKSNNPIGVVTGTTAFDNGMTRVGLSDSYSADSLIVVWEPADEWKGDFARTYFYMATAYGHMAGEWTTAEGLLTVDPSSWQTMRPWVYDLMMEWAEADPVSDTECARNEVIASIQGNRNPFVDMPELADYLWGGRVGDIFFIDPASTEPELFVPAAGMDIDFGMQSLQRGLARTVAVRGRNMSDGIHVGIEGDGFATGVSFISAADLLAGGTLPITGTAVAAGTYDATLVLTSGQAFEQRVPLHMTVVDGIPAFAPRDIVCTQYVKRFTASWLDMQLAEGQTYTVEVYSLNKNGTKKAVSGSPFEVADTFLVVSSGLAASKTYYYEVSASGGTLSSEAVQVDMPALSPSMQLPSNYLLFSSMPDVASTALPQTLSVKYLPAKENEVVLSCSAPFEVSADGEHWAQELTMSLKATVDTLLLVRLGAVPAEGHYEGGLTVSASGVSDVEVTLSADVDYTRGFFESFELTAKSAYAAADVQCSAALWHMADAIIASDNRRNDSRAVRLKVGGTATMLADKPCGCDSLWFYAGPYNTDKGTRLSVDISSDGGATWVPVVSDLSIPEATWCRYAFPVFVDGEVRLRLTASGTSGKRINIDDVQMSHFNLLAVGMGEMPAVQRVSVYTADGRYVGTSLPSRHGLYVVRQGGTVTKRLVR